MKALITNAEIQHALRTHFGIAETVDIAFSHVAGLDGICAIADQSPIAGTDQVNVADIALGTSKSNLPADTAVAEEKPKTRRRTFKKEEPVEEPTDSEEPSEDAEDTVQEEVVQEKPKRTFGKKAQTVVEEAPADSDDGTEDDEGAEEEEAVAAKPVRKFGKKPQVVEEDTSEDQDVEEETPVAKPKFGQRKSVFGKK